jgi:hypothetical protein
LYGIGKLASTNYKFLNLATISPGWKRATYPNSGVFEIFGTMFGTGVPVFKGNCVVALHEATQEINPWIKTGAILASSAIQTRPFVECVG